MSKQDNSSPKPPQRGTIIATKGLPGSGKSTWAKQYLRELEEKGVKAVRIELDEMREEFGVSPDNKETELFTQLLEERQKRINKYLSKGYTVILSDTNLTDKAQKALRQLERQGNVSEVIIKDFTHVPLDVCIQRDLARKEKGEIYVGEDVIRKMYQLIRPNDTPLTHQQVLVVGDVHGDYLSLKKLLEEVGIQKVKGIWINPQDVFLVFLGDLNDTRLDSHEENLLRSSYKALTWCKELCELEWATCVHSNHGFNLLNYLKGKKKSLKHGLNYTVEELEHVTTPDELLGIKEWLGSLPYFYSFYTPNGILVTCVHAQYTKGMSQYTPDGKSKNAVMFGTHLEGKDEQGYRLRVPWWSEVEVPPNELYICGHYHLLEAVPNWESPRVIVLDGGAGSNDGYLYGYFMSKEMNMLIHA